MARKAGRRLGLLLALLLVAAAGGFLWLRRELFRPYQGWPGPSVLVTVEPGTSSKAVFAELERAGVLRDRRLGEAALRLLHRGRGLRAGEYLFDGPRSPAAVVRAIVEGDVVVHRVTFPEGSTAEETFSLLASRGLGEEASYHALFERPDALPGVPAGAPTLEGFLFPSTYDFTRPLAERDVASRLVREFRRRLPPGYEEAARRRGLSLLEAVTLASIVEKETALAEERTLVSAVYLNRLGRGMLLQADPTTIYALKRRGLWDGRLTRAGLGFADPYNTYASPGLPPGPICNPGEAALGAAVAPAAVDYLYFVAAGDGSHRFAEDGEAHLRNVALWRKAQRAARPEERSGR